MGLAADPGPADEQFSGQHIRLIRRGESGVEQQLGETLAQLRAGGRGGLVLLDHLLEESRHAAGDEPRIEALLESLAPAGPQTDAQLRVTQHRPQLPGEGARVLRR